MELTENVKKYINSLSYEELLYKWRFAPVGDPYFQGEIGKYWGNRMAEIKKQQGNDIHVQASKSIGWDK